MSSSASDDSEDNSTAVTSMARSTPSIQTLPPDCEVFVHDPEDNEVVENSQRLVPYSQTSQEDEEENISCTKTALCFKAPSTDFDLEKLSSKTFAASTEKRSF